MKRDRSGTRDLAAVRVAAKQGAAEVVKRADEVINNYRRQVERQKRIISRLSDEVLVVRQNCSCGAAERGRQASMEAAAAEEK